LVSDRPTTSRMLLANAAGIKWELKACDGGWTLGTISVHGQVVEQPHSAGVVGMHNLVTGEQRWFAALAAQQTGEGAAILTGQDTVDSVLFSFQIDIDLAKDLPAVNIGVHWSVGADLHGWAVCFAYHSAFSHDWRCHIYPLAENSEVLDCACLAYCGVPAVLLYRPDKSVVTLFGIDPASDYLNPSTWTGRTGFRFRNGRIAPQFRIGGPWMAAGNYTFPLQLVLSSAGESTKAITELVRAWTALNNYEVQQLWVRSPADAFELFLNGRRQTTMWRPGVGYRLQAHPSANFVQLGCNPISAYLEYLVYERNGETLWRDRAFEQMDVMGKAQILDHDSPHYGAINTIYDLASGEFSRVDRGRNRGLKVDYNAHIVRYMLLLWERVRAREGVDRSDWYQTALRCGEWILRQQNPDGGMPQLIWDDTGEASNSVVSGRALAALPDIARVTGDARYLQCLERMESFLRSQVEGRYWFTGAHVDLPPNDYEQDSLWCAVEYWLWKHDATGADECLDRAIADAYLAFLMWCPKQLSWVRHPTQCAHAEQQHFLQYSVYCYCNRKVQCLYRLGEKTGESLFTDLAERALQANFLTQVTTGDWKGALYEAIADPWLARRSGFEWVGTAYMNQLSVDLMLQLVEMGMV
jgi:hypothetical protein